MGIIPGYIGLTLSFILIATIILWFFIKSDIHVGIKVLIVPLVVWYSLVLFYTPGKLLGWPTPEPFPDGSRVITFLIIEPTHNKNGGFYFWLIDDRNKNLPVSIVDSINPKDIFSYTEKDTPRSYFMPYDREFHEMLVKKKKQQGKIRGIMRLYHKMLKGKKIKKKRKGGRDDSDNKAKYNIKITDPRDLLKKSGG